MVGVYFFELFITMRHLIKKVLREFNEKNNVKEDISDFILKVLKKYPYQEYQKIVNSYLNSKDFKIEKTKDENGKDVTLIYTKDIQNPELQVKMGYNRHHDFKKMVYINTRFLNNMELYIPQKGIVICVLEWVKKKTGDKKIEDYQLEY
jgi:hypothetical protein